jgi:hypothetical protein
MTFRAVAISRRNDFLIEGQEFGTPHETCAKNTSELLLEGTDSFSEPVTNRHCVVRNESQ